MTVMTTVVLLTMMISHVGFLTILAHQNLLLCKTIFESCHTICLTLKLLIKHYAVSYTHLDVYKRQGYVCTKCCLADATTNRV